MEIRREKSGNKDRERNSLASKPVIKIQIDLPLKSGLVNGLSGLVNDLSGLVNDLSGFGKGLIWDP